MAGAPRRIVPVAVLAAACAAGGAGCGKSGSSSGQATTATTPRPSTPIATPKPGGADDDTQIRAVIDRLGRAARARDGSTICHSLITHALKVSVQTASHRPCSAAFIRSIGNPKTRYFTNSVVVKDGTNGLAKVTDQAHRVSHLVMQKTEGGWRIARIVR